MYGQPLSVQQPAVNMTTKLPNETGRQAAARERAWWVDYLIHPRLREHADTLHRVRLLVAALIIFSLLLTSVATTIFLTFEEHISATIGISIDVVLVVVNIIMLGVIRRTGKYRICAAIEIMMIFTGVVVGICVSDGIVSSPVTQLKATS